jgi:hypothetical protein
MVESFWIRFSFLFLQSDWKKLLQDLKKKKKKNL